MSAIRLELVNEPTIADFSSAGNVASNEKLPLSTDLQEADSLTITPSLIERYNACTYDNVAISSEAGLDIDFTLIELDMLDRIPLLTKIVSTDEIKAVELADDLHVLPEECVASIDIRTFYPEVFADIPVLTEPVESWGVQEDEPIMPSGDLPNAVEVIPEDEATAEADSEEIEAEIEAELEAEVVEPVLYLHNTLGPLFISEEVNPFADNEDILYEHPVRSSWFDSKKEAIEGIHQLLLSSKLNFACEAKLEERVFYAGDFAYKKYAFECVVGLYMQTTRHHDHALCTQLASDINAWVPMAKDAAHASIESLKQTRADQMNPKASWLTPKKLNAISLVSFGLIATTLVQITVTSGVFG